MGEELPPDPYLALGVTQDAAQDEVKRQYRKLVLRFHPDKVQDASQKQAAADQFYRIQKAYEVISDEAGRTRYDAQVKLAQLRKDAMTWNDDRDDKGAEEIIGTWRGRYEDERAARDAPVRYFDYGKEARNTARRDTEIREQRRSTRRTPPTAGSIPSRMPFSTTVLYDLQLDGELNGHAVSTFPDTGASWNFLSRAYARGRELRIDPSEKVAILMPTGKLVQSLGFVRLGFRFKDSLEEHVLDFHVLPTCISDVILGNTFLKATSAFTRFGHCVRRTLRQVLPHRLCFLGGTQHRMGGWLNESLVAALPDTGSDLMLMSRSYAEEKAFSIDDNLDFCVMLQMGDLSTTSTTGYVGNVEWSFSDQCGNKMGDVELCGFWIVDDLTCDVILSDEFLLRTNALEEMGQCEFELETGQLALSAIKAVRFRSKKTAPPPPSSYEEWSRKVQKERVYQSDVEGDIQRLSGADKEQAEKEIKRRWAELIAQRPPPPSTPVPRSATTPERKSQQYDTSWPFSKDEKQSRRVPGRSPLSKGTLTP